MIIIIKFFLTLLHSERPKLYTLWAFLSAKGLKPRNEAMKLYRQYASVPILFIFE